MYLHSLTIKNFRQFSNLTIEFNKGLNLLVGENNSGKSSVIDAIRLALDTNSSEWVRFKENDFRAGEVELTIQLKFENLSISESAICLEYLTHEINQESGIRCSVLYINMNAVLKSNIDNKSQFVQTEVRSGRFCDGPNVAREVRNYLATTYLKPLRDAESELSSGKSSRLSQILNSSESLAGKNDVVKRLIELLVSANNDVKSDLAIKEVQDSITTLVNSLTFKADIFNPTLNIIGSKAFDDMGEAEKTIALKSILEKLTLQFNTSGEKQGLGYESLLFMATELMLLKQETNVFSLLLIEEPEAHLHPQLQMKFIKYLSKEQEELQCILSTHSPNLASKAPLESIILMQDGVAFPLRKGYTALEPSDYIFLEKFLDATKANLFFARAVLLVEGIAELVLLPKIAELLNRSLEDYGVSIVDVSGLSRKRYKKIYRPFISDAVKREPLPIKVACVTDLDLWPDKAEKRDDNPIGFKEKNHPSKDKKGNLQYWLSEYDDIKLQKKIDQKKEFDGGNVKTFISDEWTLEYCLVRSGLEKEVYEAIKGDEVGFDQLSSDSEERAVQIYELAEKEKSDLSYKLSALLSKYENRSDELIKKLPTYLVDAIEFVTEPLNISKEVDSD